MHPPSALLNGSCVISDRNTNRLYLKNQCHPDQLSLAYLLSASSSLEPVHHRAKFPQLQYQLLICPPLDPMPHLQVFAPMLLSIKNCSLFISPSLYCPSSFPVYCSSQLLSRLKIILTVLCVQAPPSVHSSIQQILGKYVKLCSCYQDPVWNPQLLIEPVGFTHV